MKKNLLTFCMLILTLGIFTSKSVAQEVVGGESDGFFDLVTGEAISMDPSGQAKSPNYTLQATRNNGNGTTIDGLSQVRLHISGSGLWDAELVSIAWNNKSQIGAYKVSFSGMKEELSSRRNYWSFPLIGNIPPMGKLLFTFKVFDSNYPTGRLEYIFSGN